MTNILIFKTNLATTREARAISMIFNRHEGIFVWTVDYEDIDNVLRIEARGDVTENDIIALIQPTGFLCEVLPD